MKTKLPLTKRMKIEDLIKMYGEASILAYRLWGGDLKIALNWMHTKNPAFFDVSPFEVIFGGEGEHVLNWLRERAS